MDIFHTLSEKASHFKLIKFHLKAAKTDIRRDITISEDGYTYKKGDVKYLKQIESLHLELFHRPLFSWLLWIYRFKAKELVTVVVDDKDQVVAYDLFIIEPSEYEQRIIHELYVGVRTDLQNKGMGVKLRQFCASCYDEGYFTGISTLAAHNNIKAIRTAQKAGYGILKESVKPPAHYMFKSLICRYPKE